MRNIDRHKVKACMVLPRLKTCMLVARAMGLRLGTVNFAATMYG